VNLCRGIPGRYPLLAPARLGALLGLGEGILFVLVSSLSMPATTPEDAAKSLVLSLVILGAGILVCAGFSALTATLRLRGYAHVLEQQKKTIE
jgi:hypothetical protein